VNYLLTEDQEEINLRYRLDNIVDIDTLRLDCEDIKEASIYLKGDSHLFIHIL
jgi:hypothetical protein